MTTVECTPTVDISPAALLTRCGTLMDRLIESAYTALTDESEMTPELRAFSDAPMTAEDQEDLPLLLLATHQALAALDRAPLGRSREDGPYDRAA